MVPASSLLHKNSMTRKRVKFGLAILGLLVAFLMGLLALMFVPTLASADKGSGGSAWEEGHGQSGNPAYFEPADTNHTGTHGAGHSGANPPQGDVGPCAGTPNPCEAWNGPGDGAGHYSEGQGGGSNGDPGHGAKGETGNDTHAGPQGGQGDQPGPFAGWLPSGGLPGGGGGDESQSCTKDNSHTDKSDTDSDKETGKKTCDKSDDGQSGTSGNQPDDFSDIPSGDPAGNGPTDGTSGDFSSGFFGGAAPNDNPNNGPSDELPDPNCFPFGDFCSPQNDDPPNNSLTDTPNEIPEPFTLSLFAVGLTGAAALRRSRRKTTVRPPAG